MKEQTRHKEMAEAIARFEEEDEEEHEDALCFHPLPPEPRP